MTRPCALCGRERPAYTPCVACLEVLAHDAVAELVSRISPDPTLICDCGQLRERCGHPEVLK